MLAMRVGVAGGERCHAITWHCWLQTVTCTVSVAEMTRCISDNRERIPD